MRKYLNVSLLILILCVLLIGVITLVRPTKLTDIEMTERIASIYGGSVQNIVDHSSKASIFFSRDEAKYEVDIDLYSGAFSNLIVVYEPPASRSENVANITEEQAIAIASNKYFGTVESSQFIENGDDSYYEIRIASNINHFVIHVSMEGEITLVQVDS